MNKIMVLKGGSPAIHKLGDIGREHDDYIRIHSEDEENYIGSFESGFGFINVKFNKLDVRPCTKEEIDYLNKQYYAINNNPLYKYNLDYNGEFVKKEISNVIPFQTNEFVMIKRTSGKWEEGKIVEVNHLGVRVEVDVVDNFRGKVYTGEIRKGYKFISNEDFDTHLKKMKTFIGNSKNNT